VIYHVVFIVRAPARFREFTTFEPSGNHITHRVSSSVREDHLERKVLQGVVLSIFSSAVS
jgi:hypothetical protein